MIIQVLPRQRPKVAAEAGADVVCLCETNGGCFPAEVARGTTAVMERLAGRAVVGIHTHNDAGLGIANALDILCSARKFGAQEALHMGMINRVLPADQLLPAVREYAKQIATTVSPRSVSVMKRQVWDAQFQTLAESIVVGDAEMKESFLSEDFKEGVAHFMEKRAPKFSGR